MSEEETEKITLNLSKKQLKKVPKQENAQNVRILILDENELQKIDNIDSYLKIETLSLSKNQLLRMYGVCRLHCLRELNLSFNGILSIEGLKDCIYLRYLNLEGNNIKNIEHLQNNTKLEYLNLSENGIGSIGDISHLKYLKELYLHSNRLTHLRQCDKYLPTSLEILTLAKNSISDLNEICTLSGLCNLQSITICENPCVTMTLGPNGFDHRPFVLNWCMSLKVIDGFMVDPIESLKAEWLYSQGRGRQFRVGEQSTLAKYLSSVCPLIGKALENENERKLRLILSKAQHHQRQLQEEISEHSITSVNSSPSSGRKRPTSRIQSPRFSRLTGRQGSPDSMISSYHGNTTNEQTSNHSMQMTTSLIENIKNDSLMSQSFDSGSSNNTTSTGSTVTNQSASVTSKLSNSQEASTPRNATPNPYNGGPLAAASKMVPVPETLMSPDVCPASVVQRVTVSAINTQIHNSKLIKNKDNRHHSPKMSSPKLRRAVEYSPVASPRKVNTVSSLPHCNITTVQTHQAATATAHGQAHEPSQSSSNIRSRLNSNSVHVSAPETGSAGASSDEDSDRVNVDKLKTIHNKAAQKCLEQKENASNDKKNDTQNTETSAVMIQKIWRGYRTRKKTKDIAEKLLKKRTYEYIDKLTKDMEMTKAQLENERKIQQLQMQAINALWKKVSSMQGCTSASTIGSDALSTDGALTGLGNNDSSKTLTLDNSSTAVVSDLTKTCSMLTSQVQQLQGSMRDILNCLTLFCNLPQENVKKLLSAGVAEALSNEKRDSAATQTEIVAVHTPQMENQSFPFAKARPSTLSLETKASKSSSVGSTKPSTDSIFEQSAEEACEEEEIGAVGYQSDEHAYECGVEKADENKEETEC